MNDKTAVDSLIDSLSIDVNNLELMINSKKFDLDKVGLKGRTALMTAASEGNIAAMKILLENGASVNAIGGYGMSALHEAASNGELRAVDYLVDQGAEIDAVNAQGVTPLMCAAAWGHLGVVVNLLSYGADVDKVDITGGSAVDAAKEKGEDEVWEYLEQYLKSR